MEKNTARKKLHGSGYDIYGIKIYFDGDNDTDAVQICVHGDRVVLESAEVCGNG